MKTHSIRYVSKYLIIIITFLFLPGNVFALVPNYIMEPVLYTPPSTNLPIVQSYYINSLPVSGVIDHTSLSQPGLPYVPGGTIKNAPFNYNMIWDPSWSGQFGIKSKMEFITNTNDVYFDYSIPYSVTLKLPDKAYSGEKIYLDNNLDFHYSNSTLIGTDTGLTWGTELALAINAPLDATGWYSNTLSFSHGEASGYPDELQLEGNVKATAVVPFPVIDTDIPIVPIEGPQPAHFNYNIAGYAVDFTSLGKRNLVSGGPVVDTAGSNGWAALTNGGAHILSAWAIAGC